jgi:hypothetical protein
MTVTSYRLAVVVQCRRMCIITVGIDHRGHLSPVGELTVPCTFVLRHVPDDVWRHAPSVRRQRMRGRW